MDKVYRKNINDSQKGEIDQTIGLLDTDKIDIVKFVEEDEEKVTDELESKTSDFVEKGTDRPSDESIDANPEILHGEETHKHSFEHDVIVTKESTLRDALKMKTDRPSD